MATPEERHLHRQDVEDVCAETWPTMHEALEEAQTLTGWGWDVQLASVASPDEHQQAPNGSRILAEVRDPADGGVIGEIRYWTGQ